MPTINETKKVTRTTIKGFIAREFKANNLYIKNESDFDGMVDCVMPLRNSEFRQATQDGEIDGNTLGIKGAWFVGQSRDLFNTYADDNFIGYRVYNCCGSFIIAMKRLY